MAGTAPSISSAPTVAPSAPNPVAIPPLQNGDRLSAAEFWRRYSAMPSSERAELIQGVVYMSSPVTHENHGSAHFSLIGWLFLYQMVTPGVDGGDNSTLSLDIGNTPQSDAYLIILPSHGGRVRIDDKGYIVGAPELAAEVSATSTSIDLGDKLKTYLQNGVREYVVWRVFDRAIDWFVLRGDHYEPLKSGTDGIYRSEVFPGLWLDAAALIARDMATVARVAQQGTASPEHAAFVAQLKK